MIGVEKIIEEMKCHETVSAPYLAMRTGISHSRVVKLLGDLRNIGIVETAGKIKRTVNCIGRGRDTWQLTIMGRV